MLKRALDNCLLSREGVNLSYKQSKGLQILYDFKKYLEHLSSSNIKEVTTFEKTAILPPKTAGSGVIMKHKKKTFPKLF